MAPTTDLFSRIASDDSESDTPEKCRKRRHRRIAMRRTRISSGRFSLPQFHHLPSPRAMQETLSNQQPHSVANMAETQVESFSVVENPMPEFGWLSIQGLSKSMDDAVFVKEECCRPNIIGGSSLHFFAVHDGCGGSHVSTLCKEMMHKIMVEELTSLHISKATAIVEDSCRLGLAPGYQMKQQNEEQLEDLLRVGIERSFHRMDQVALSTCACGKNGRVCGSQSMKLAAVVALLSRDRIVVASCGDSRAVLCRDGKAVPLSLDHKPERPDEMERIGAAGGKLINQNATRVYGIITRSCSLGDNMLKRVTTTEPEISITQREGKDECLILASHALWDVLSDDLACQVASKCLREGSPATTTPLRSRHFSGRRRPIKDGGGGVRELFPSKSKFAAAILCRLALARGSHDNISVIAIDLMNKPK